MKNLISRWRAYGKVAKSGEKRKSADERYLVIGSGKTGTTVISKTIQNTTKIENYFLEPKDVSVFENLRDNKDGAVVKVIFDQWMTQLPALKAIINNELGTNFSLNIFICRDPRAELVSRLHYIAYPYFSQREVAPDVRNEWVQLFEKKERNPRLISLKDMTDAMMQRFEIDLTASAAEISDGYAEFLRDIDEDRRVILKYEDFISGNIENYPWRHLLSGDREVGQELKRTRRTGGLEDWKAFLLKDDVEWLNKLFERAIDLFGYDQDVDVGGQVRSEACSLYVERLIEEAQTALRAQTNGGTPTSG